MSTLSKIVGTEVPFYVRFPSAIIPDQRATNGRLVQREINLNDARAKVLSCKDYKGGMYHINGVRHSGKNFGIYLMDTAPVSLITGKEKVTLEKHFHDIEMDSLRDRLDHSFYIGSDHTIFVEDEKGNVIPAPLFLGGNKDTSKDRTDANYTESRPMYFDGMRARFQTKHEHCLELHSDGVAGGLWAVTDAARKKFPKAKASVKTAMSLPKGVVPETFIDTAKSCHNAYGLYPKEQYANVQFGESHIHFGWHDMTIAKAAPVVKVLDAILGVACVSLLGDMDDPRRRQIHFPGDFAVKGGRLEYRALSNAWLCHPTMFFTVMDVARKVAMFGFKGYGDAWEASEDEVIQTILKSDVKRARKILEKNKKIFFHILQAAYRWTFDEGDEYYDGGYDDNGISAASCRENTEVLFSIFYNGLPSAVKDPTNIIGNWHLSSNDYSWRDQKYEAYMYGAHAELKAGRKV